jgi:hypothetical protein
MDANHWFGAIAAVMSLWPKCIISDTLVALLLFQSCYNFIFDDDDDIAGISTPLTWFQTTFSMPPTGGSVVVNMQGASRGHFYINGVDMGRFVIKNSIKIITIKKIIIQKEIVFMTISQCKRLLSLLSLHY